MVQSSEARVKGITHTGLVVSNMERALAFYRDLLGFSVVYDFGLIDVPETSDLTGVPNSAMNTMMLKGSEGTILELFEYKNPAGQADHEPRHYDIGFTHVALEVSGLQDIYKKLEQSGMVQFLTPLRSYEGLNYAYLRGPDRVFLELLEYS